MIQTTQKNIKLPSRDLYIDGGKMMKIWNWSNTFNQQKEIFEGQLLLKQTMFERDADFIS